MPASPPSSSSAPSRRNTAGTAPSTAGALLLSIARARPHCRDAILAELGLTTDALKSLAGAREPFFLGGYAFAFEDSGYYWYGDLSNRHSWIYLEGDLLTVGTEFSIQLVPEFIDDAWLYGRIWAVGYRPSSRA